MAASLPTAADVRKAREQAAKTATERAGVARTPLLAVLGAGDYAVTTVTNAVTTVRARAAERADTASQRFSGFPHKITADELRKTADDVRGQAGQAYADLADRGEKAWGRIRKQPQVKRALATIESYTEKLDARVDDLVDGAHDAAEQTLSTVTRQTRSTGEKAARATQRFTGRAAERVVDAASDASGAVADAGAKAADAISEAGDEAAGTTRSVTRKAANRTAPETAAKPAGRKPTDSRAATSDTTSSDG